MIYFDNSATTPPCREAIEAANRAMRESWGNPSSSHAMGVEAKRILDSARQNVANSLGIRRMTDGKCVFTSGGTEANNLAVFGSVYSKERPVKGRSRGKIIVSDGEHASIEAAVPILEKDGFCVFRIPTVGGALDFDALEREATPDVIFASVMKVNNETGAIYDTRTASRIIKEKAPRAIFHTDCVQAYMKMKLSSLELGADLITVSAHKIFSLKGAGALCFTNEIVKTKKLVRTTAGGGQEEGFRAGTEGMPAIAAFGEAASLGQAELSERIARCRAIGDYAFQKVGALDGVRLNLPHERIPNVLSVTVPGIKSETMLNYLSGEGICVSKSSACSTRSKNLSAALLAFGLTEEDVDSTMRLSFSHLNTEEEIDFFCDVLGRGINSLARIKKG